MTPEIQDTEDFLPSKVHLSTLRRAVQGCRGCELYADADQAVFGEGLRRSRLMIIGETPGDVEDRTGRPFTGPAGHLLDKALSAASLDRADLYLTNAVKHFRYVTRGATGTRRIHQTPKQSHIRACRPWLSAELDVVAPEGAVLLGSVAGKALYGPDFRVGEYRGRVIDLPDRSIWSVATIHPSAALRAEDRQSAFAGLVTDLELARSRLG